MCDIAIKSAINSHLNFSIYYDEHKCCLVFTNGDELRYTISLYEDKDFINIKVPNQKIYSRLSEIMEFSKIKYIWIDDDNKKTLIYEAP